MKCEECINKQLLRDCIECKELINAKELARKPRSRLEVKLIKIGSKQEFNSVIKLISPVDLVLEDILPPGKYKLKLLNEIELIITTVKNKGQKPYQSFDIISVFRGAEKRERLSPEDFAILSQSPEDLIESLVEQLPESSKDLIRDRLLGEVERSRLLEALKAGDILKYKNGSLESLAVDRDISLPQEYLRSFIINSLRTNSYARETVIDSSGSRVYDLHALPIDDNTGGIMIIDVTSIIEVERGQKRIELEIYKDVIEAVTNGKLRLLDRLELEAELRNGKVSLKSEVARAQDLAEVREEVRELIKKFDLSSEEEFRIILTLSEAATNALKHAGGGKIIIKIWGAKLRMIVIDQGAGIDFTNLPRATLMDNYSNSLNFSLGCGFTIMLKFMDAVFLKTDAEGTTLILEKRLGGRRAE